MQSTLRSSSPLSVLFAAIALSACGGGDDAVTTLPAAGNPPPATVSTTVTGSVVKGPVSAAQVCGYTVAANARGSALGSCTTSDASGNYSLTVPAGSGPLWVEATGGTYTDETTGTATSLPAGSALRSIVTANGSAVTSMLTPLTTLALNAAAASVGSTGTLDTAAFSTAAAALLASFKLPADLNISSTVPTFGSDINSYGTALTAISKMVANGQATGQTLAAILATAQPSSLAAAYATAAAPTVPPVSGGGAGGGAGGGTGGTLAATGTVTVGGVTAPGAATSMTPQATGFEVKVTGTSTKYRFFKESASPSTKLEITVEVPLVGNTTVAYYDLADRSSLPFCSSNCRVTVTPASGATHPVTLSFANTPLTGGVTLNGSLVGDAPGAAWTVADLPGATTSSLTLNGAAVSVLSSTDSTFDASGVTLRSVVLSLSDGSRITMSRNGTAAFTADRIVLPLAVASCAANCNISATDTTATTRVTFANTPLSGGLVLNGTVDYPRTSGSLTSSDAGGFTPVTSNVESLNDKRTLTFSVLGTAAQAGLSLVTVEVQGGRVVRAQATVGIATQVLSCFDNGSFINVPACTGVTVAADSRTVTFNNAVLFGGPLGAAGRSVTFNGTLVAKGP
jgi:hypothetical protein